MRNLTEDDWIAHPDALYNKSSGQEQFLVEFRNKINVLAEIQDHQASYEYDEMAVIELNDEFYLLRTSGCSCPSPTETWSIQVGPTTLPKVIEAVESGEYFGFTPPVKELVQFLKELRSYEVTQ